MTEEWLRRAIDAAAGAITENASLLDELDAAIGDGDHGSNLSRGFRAVADLADELAVLDLGRALHQAGMTLVTTVGGACRPALRQPAHGHGESRPPGPGRDTRRFRGDAAPGDRGGATARQGRRRREDDAGCPGPGLRGARQRCGGRAWGGRSLQPGWLRLRRRASRPPARWQRRRAGRRSWASAALGIRTPERWLPVYWSGPCVKAWTSGRRASAPSAAPRFAQGHPNSGA